MKRILLVDDDEGIRVTWKRFHDFVEPVFRGQLEMEVAHDLEMMREKMKHNKYDVIILDLKFAGHGAEDTMSFIAENVDKFPPIVVLTGDSDIWVRRRCMMLGASSFWLKQDAVERPDLFFKDVYNRYLYKYDAPKL